VHYVYQVHVGTCLRQYTS